MLGHKILEMTNVGVVRYGREWIHFRLGLISLDIYAWATKHDGGFKGHINYSLDLNESWKSGEQTEAALFALEADAVEHVMKPFVEKFAQGSCAQDIERFAVAEEVPEWISEFKPDDTTFEDRQVVEGILHFEIEEGDP
jgi:hypothetical protein